VGDGSFRKEAVGGLGFMSGMAVRTRRKRQRAGLDNPYWLGWIGFGIIGDITFAAAFDALLQGEKGRETLPQIPSHPPDTNPLASELRRHQHSRRIRLPLHQVLLRLA